MSAPGRSPWRVVALVVGCLLLLPGVGLLVGGGGLAVAVVLERDGEGYLTDLVGVRTSTAALTTAGLDLVVDPATPDRIVDLLDTDVRIEAGPSESGRPLFVGIARTEDVDRYLAGVEHDQVVDVVRGQADTRGAAGTRDVDVPTQQDFWQASASGPGPLRLDWAVLPGRWSVALMNADAAVGLSTDVRVGVRSDLLLPLAAGLAGAGAVLTLLAVLLVVVGAGPRRLPRVPSTTSPAGASWAGVPVTGRARPAAPSAHR